MTDWPGTPVEKQDWPGTPAQVAPNTEKSGIRQFVEAVPGGIVKGFGEGLETALTYSPMTRPIAKLLPLHRGIEAAKKPILEQLPAAEGTAGQYGERVGEFTGNPLSYIGPGGAALKTVSAVAGALGSEGAGQLAKGTELEPYARAAGGLIAGAGPGVVSAERAIAKLGAELPSMSKIKESATKGYDYLKTSDTRITPEGTQELLHDIKTNLHTDQFRDYLAPNTFKAIEELGASGSATIGDIDGVRRLLGRVPMANETDRNAANRAISAIDDWLMHVPDHHVMSGNPAADAAVLRHAQASWAAYKQLQQLEKSTTQAQHRAGATGSGANTINAARQEVRKILDSDKKSRGMSDAAKEKMEEIVLGTWATNRARTLSKFAPSGPVSATTSILTGLYDLGAGAAVAVGGVLAKHLGGYLTDRQIRQLEELIRAESPIGRPIAAKNAPAMAEAQAQLPAAIARPALVAGSGSPLAAGPLQQTSEGYPYYGPPSSPLATGGP